MHENEENQTKYSIEPLMKVMGRLLGPDGCPWDKKQDHHSLRKNLLEEAHEVIETIDNGDMVHMKEELGDLLLQIVFHAQIAEANGYFDWNDVVDGISEKLIRRHPHIFADAEVLDAQGVLANWEQIKLQEKDPDDEQSIMSKMPPTLPALMQAYKIQDKAHRVGFDWPDITGPWSKIYEELQELEEARAGNGDVKKELGDVLFSVVNVARFLSIDSEEALKASNQVFVQRFKYLEAKAKLDKKTLAGYTIEELDQWWAESKNEH